MNKEEYEIPYKFKSVRIGQTLDRVNTVKGVKTKDDKFRWQTSDSVKPFETGLPLISESVLNKEFVDPAEVERQIKNFNNEIIDEFEPEGIRELLKESEEENDYKQNEVSDTSSFTRLYQKLNKKKQKIANRPFTGITKAPPSENLIDSIGKLSLRTVQGTSKLEDYESPFPVLPRRVIKTRETLAQSQLVKTTMKKAFKPNTSSFTDSTAADDFPMDELFQTVSRRPSNYVSVRDSYDQVCETFEEEEEKSLLIDIRDQDIFWTSDNAPFTRKEVEMMKKFREQCRARSDLHNLRTQQVLEERDKTIARTFQSSLAFNKEIELAYKEKERSQNLPPGKGESYELSWKIAAKETDKDPGSLPFRKKSWEKFVHYVSANGPLKKPSEKKLANKFRDLLIKGTTVDKHCFFEAISVLKKDDFSLLKTAMIIEVMRDVCVVDLDELLTWMKKRGIPTEIVRAAPEAIQRVKRAKIRALRDQEELMKEAKLMRGDIQMPSLDKGLPMFRNLRKKTKK